MAMLLPQIATLEYGFAFDSKKFNSDSNGMPLIRIRDVQRGYSTTSFDGDYDSRYLVSDGDLLIGMDGNFVINRWTGGKALLNQRVCRVTPIEGLIDEEYLRLFLKVELKRIEDRTPFATVKHLSARVLANVTLPDVPFDEQRKISQSICLIEELQQSLKTLEAELTDLGRAIYDKDFNQKTWPTKRLDTITECLDSKRKPVTAAQRPSGNVPYFGANGQQGWIDKAIFDETLILVAEDGGHFDAPERGVAYKVSGPSWVNNHAHVLRPMPEITAEYLHRSLKHFNFLPFISGSTRAKLNKNQLNRVEIPVPPLNLQRDFDEKMAIVDQKMGNLGVLVDEANDLYNAELARHFPSVSHE